MFRMKDGSIAMKSIMTTYPDFQTLPKGLKKMLLASESFFFNEVPSPVQEFKRGERPAVTGSNLRRSGGLNGFPTLDLPGIN